MGLAEDGLPRLDVDGDILRVSQIRKHPICLISSNIPLGSADVLESREYLLFIVPLVFLFYSVDITVHCTVTLCDSVYHSPSF
jgi:hypothetical protein